MDYGGPFCEIIKPDEAFPGGRTMFREHYLKLRRLRATMGPDGLFYSHTGPFYSALGMNFMDGYTSGEGERGLLIKGRKIHEYYSMSAVAPGTLWSAAFPEYSSKEIVPFLAAAGQYPHAPLGMAGYTCSLAHPQVPGINDLNFRPLWKTLEHIPIRKEYPVSFRFQQFRRIRARSGNRTLSDDLGRRKTGRSDFSQVSHHRQRRFQPV